MGTFRIEERHNELGYLEKRVVLFPESDAEKQSLDVFEVMYKWGSALERQSEGGELAVVAMVPVPASIPGKVNKGTKDA